MDVADRHIGTLLGQSLCDTRPEPLDPPVTSATLPFSRFMFFSLAKLIATNREAAAVFP
jgi:hypothetical protein